MIRLLTFPPAFGLCTPTPFGLKVDAYLRMANHPYELVPLNNPRKAPKRKLPIIDDDGTVVADSSHIVEHLKRKYGDPLDGKLSADQRATAHIVKRMLEEGLYWVLVYSRWADDETWPKTKAAFFEAMPAPLRLFVPGLVRGMLIKQLFAQGTGRHSRDDLYALGAADLSALANHLGEKPYFLGDHPTSLDASAFGFLGQVLLPSFSTPLKVEAEKHANLVTYVRRVRDRYYANG